MREGGGVEDHCNQYYPQTPANMYHSPPSRTECDHFLEVECGCGCEEGRVGIVGRWCMVEVGTRRMAPVDICRLCCSCVCVCV